ncbi:hypothetical protein J6V85_03120 [Candidatus Saccharibacteria bacterium]|nr:hypothetical protein [Candidatus Saccharibacteria bacterium]
MSQEVKKQSAKESITPNFLQKKEEDKESQGFLKKAEQNALDSMSNLGGQNNFLNSVAGKALNKRGAKSASGNNKSSKKLLAAGGATAAILVLLIFAVFAIIFAVPVVVLATIDYGLQASLGYDDTTAILEEQAEHVAVAQLKRGKFNSNYAEGLANNKIEIGQVTLAGDFVKTNTYLANLDDSEMVASLNDDYSNNETSELAIRFEGEVISAGDLVEKLESNPRLYAAFARGTDISARYYYSDEVERVYKDFGLTRNNFANYKQTSDIEKNNKQFEDIFNKVIEKVARVGLNGYDTVCPETIYDENGNIICLSRTFTDINEQHSVGESLAQSISSQVYEDNQPKSTRRAVSLLNAAVSANEPYIAAGTFLATEEALNRARIDGDGPVDPLLNAFSEVNNVKVTNVETGKDEVVKESIFGTRNFLAAVEDEHYEVDDARGYSRDRIMNMTRQSVDSDTRLGLKDAKQVGIVVEVRDGVNADMGNIRKSSNSLTTTFYDDVYKTTKTSIGGNRIVMGGSFLSNSINLHVLGSMPSDKQTIVAYKKEVDEVIARRAEAERATLSPFDVSSKYTFLGSIVRKMGNFAVKNMASNSSTGSYLTSSISSLFNDSFNTLVSSVAYADDEEKESFLTTHGDCPTANSAASVEGDLYCSTHNTTDTTRMEWTLQDYINALRGSLDENGNIIEKSPLAYYVIYGMGRGSTVGVKDIGICETYKENLSWWKKLWIKLKASITSPKSLYDPCTYADPTVADGSKYTLSSQNPNSGAVSLYTSFVLYDTVSSLLDDKMGSVASFKEKYYSEHPLDNSDAGIVARRSGMSKEDAQIALNYAAYLDYIAKYQPGERYAFSKPLFDIHSKMPAIIVDDKELQEELAIVARKTLFKDLRTISTTSI